MDRPAFAVLDHRGAVSVAGEDSVPFLQGLVSNDMDRVAPNRAIWTAFLTPQGKFLHEFMIARIGDNLVLDCERDRRADLIRRLRIYKLRSKVTVAESDATMVALFGPSLDQALGFALAPGEARAVPGGIIYGDPRLAALGLRAMLDADGLAWLRARDLAEAQVDHWDRMRIALGVPDGSRDLPVDKAILLENGFDELGGLDWDKGCYMGQELTARTRYRGLIRKRLLPVTFDGPPPAADTPILCEGKAIGVLHSINGSHALARLRLDALDSGSALTADDTRVVPRVPDWVRLPSRPSSG